MKKLVNGRIVDVKNIELFEKAAEHIAIGRSATNKALNIKDADLSSVELIVSTYYSIYKSIPYPLYAIDEDIKYAVIANCLKSVTTYRKPTWTDNGLFICIDEEKGVVLNFVNDTWGLIHMDSIREDNTSIDLYKNHLGYAEFKWVMDQISNKKSTNSFYNIHMGDFIKACKNQPMVMKWELTNMLNFGNVPNRIELVHNKIIDLFEKTSYIIDIYVSGMRKTEEKQHVWNLFDDDDTEPVVKPKYVKSFGYTAYKKISTDDENKIKPNADKLVKCELTGLMSLFLSLTGIRSAKENNRFEDYTGFICDNNLIYEINNRVFIAKSNVYVEPKEIARGVKLYSYDRGLVYLVKSTVINPSILKENIYSYSLRDGNLRLCKIRFVSR